MLFLILVVAAAFLFFLRLGSPLQEPQESRYAEIARQMLAADSWLVPVLQGSPYYDKPPLLYWLVMGCYQVFGVHDWAARLVSCTSGFLCVLLVYGWGKEHVGRRAAFLGAMMLCLSGRFIQIERMLTIDSLLCLVVVAGWATAHRALHAGRPHWRWWLTSAAIGGLGLLTKGPVALVLLLVPIAVYSWLGRRPYVLPSPGRTNDYGLSMLGAYVAMAVAVASPWYIAVAVRDSDFLYYFFWFHHVERFLRPFDHAEPIWFYLPELAMGIWPWILLAPGLIVWKFRQRQERNPALLFFMLAFGWCFTFYSLSGCKRALYILPALPPLMLALGGYVDSMLPRAEGWAALWRHHNRSAYALTGIMLVTGLAGAVTAAVSRLISPVEGVALAALAGLGLLATALHGWRQPFMTWRTCGLVSFLVLILIGHTVMPGYARRFSYRGQVRRHAQRSADLAVICYPRRWDSVSFYLQRNDVCSGPLPKIIQQLKRGQEAILFLKPGRDRHALDKLLQRLPSSMAFRPAGRQGRLTVGYVTRRKLRGLTSPAR